MNTAAIHMHHRPLLPAQSCRWPLTAVTGNTHAVVALLSVAQLRAALLLLALLPLVGCGMVAKGKNSEGVRLFSQGMYEQAIQRFQAAIQTNNQDPNAYYNMAAVYHQLGTLQNRQDYLDQAESYYNQSLDKDGNFTDAYRGLTVLLSQENRSADAYRLLEGWSTRSPANADARIELARFFDESGDPDKAKVQLLEAINLDPNNSRALAALGKLREDLGEVEQALVAYQRSLQQKQDQPQVAARVAALRSALNARDGGATTATIPPPGTFPSRR